MLLSFIQRFVTQSKSSLIFTKILSFLHKTYFSNNLHHTYKNADGNSKFNTTKLNPWKLTFWKHPVIAKNEIKVSVLRTTKSDFKAKNFIILISFYGNYLVVTPRLFPSLFLFISSAKTLSKHLKNKNHKWDI